MNPETLASLRDAAAIAVAPASPHSRRRARLCGLPSGVGAVWALVTGLGCGRPPAHIEAPPHEPPPASGGATAVASAAPRPGPAPDPQPAAPLEPAAPPEPAGTPDEIACRGGNAAACIEAGVAYHEGDGVEQDAERALTLFAKACDAGLGLGCHNAGIITALGKGMAEDLPRGYAFFSRGCELGHAPACGLSGTMLFKGQGVAQDEAAAIPLLEKGCTADERLACLNLGAAYANGDGVAVDLDKSEAFSRQACRLGNESGCQNAEKIAKAKAQQAHGVAGANLTVGSLTADGLTLADMSCRADGLGLLGTVVIASSLSKKRTQLKACTQGKPARVRWSFSGGHITTVKGEDMPAAAAACVERALRGAATAGDGECAATITP